MVKEIPIESIIRDKNFNMRKSLDKQVIGDYREPLDALPPVVVYETEWGYILADGVLVEMEKKQRSVGQSLINEDMQSIHIPTFDVK